MWQIPVVLQVALQLDSKLDSNSKEFVFRDKSGTAVHSYILPGLLAPTTEIGISDNRTRRFSIALLLGTSGPLVMEGRVGTLDALVGDTLQAP